MGFVIVSGVVVKIPGMECAAGVIKCRGGCGLSTAVLC